MQQTEIAEEDIETGLAKLNTSKRPARAGRWGFTAELSRFLIFILQEVSHGAKTISRRKSAGRRDHPQYAGPARDLSVRPDRRGGSGCCADVRSLIAAAIAQLHMFASAIVRKRIVSPVRSSAAKSAVKSKGFETKIRVP
jgi:hypothetical protein